MIDASSKPFEENIALTTKVVEYAHDHGVVVEAELGTLAGIEDEVNVSAADSSYTRPEEVEEFVRAPAATPWPSPSAPATAPISSSRSAPARAASAALRHSGGGVQPPAWLPHRAPRLFLRAAGVCEDDQRPTAASMPDAIGVPEDQLRQAAKLAVCKINIDSDLRLAMTAGVRQQLIADPANFDPRSYLKVGRQYVKDLVKDKIVNVLGSDNKL